MDTHYGSPGPALEEDKTHLLSPPRADIRIQLFGSITVQRTDATLRANELGGTKPRQILAMLALNLGVPVSKDRLIELLWGERAPAAALPTLESYVSILRRHLQPGAGRHGPLQTTTGGYLLDRRVAEVDHARFGSLVALADRGRPQDRLQLLRTALDLASAPLFADETDLPWAADERARNAADVTATQVLAAEAAAAQSLSELSIELARAALRNESLNERAWTALVLGLEQAGRPGEGLQHYERFRRLLDQELGCSPGRALRDAHARLLQATGGDDGELADVVSALLLLHDQMHHPEELPPPAPESLSHAGEMLDAFLRRALAIA